MAYTLNDAANDQYATNPDDFLQGLGDPGAADRGDQVDQGPGTDFGNVPDPFQRDLLDTGNTTRGRNGLPFDLTTPPTAQASGGGAASPTPPTDQQLGQG